MIFSHILTLRLSITRLDLHERVPPKQGLEIPEEFQQVVDNQPTNGELGLVGHYKYIVCYVL